MKFRKKPIVIEATAEAQDIKDAINEIVRLRKVIEDFRKELEEARHHGMWAVLDSYDEENEGV